jgi:hypothetical protein
MASPKELANIISDYQQFCSESPEIVRQIWGQVRTAAY